MATPPWTSYDTLIILVTILVPASMIALLLGMMRSLRRRQLLQRGLVHIVFLQEKRRRFLTLLSLLASFFIASGIVDALTGVGLLTGGVSTAMSAAAFIGGAVALFLLIWTSLRPGRLTEDQQAQLAWLPQQYYPMVLGPIELGEAGGL